MSKVDLAKMAKSVQATIVKHSPEILTGIGIAGMATTTVLAVKATPKALRLLEEKKRDEGVDKLTAADTVKTTWKCYIPAAVTGIASATCLIGGSSISLRRNAALVTAFKLSETALAEYREQVVKTIGEKKEKTVRDNVSSAQMEKNPVSQNNIIVTNRGASKCFDPLSGRYFKSDRDSIVKSINILNKSMIHDIYGFITLNDLYDELGLEHVDIGDRFGWHVEKGLIEVDFSAHLDEEGEPCLAIQFLTRPDYEYSR